MNLCLSGLAECYPAAAYPAGVDDAVARIRELQPDAVTITEACRQDAEGMAARVGYSVRFARVRYGGAPLACVDPGGRGLFGNAVLTRSPILSSETDVFTAQEGPEERRWLCATTRRGPDVCTAHLETPYDDAAAAARDAQCAELADVLARRPSRKFVFGGDVNRRDSCAPPGAWGRTDEDADQTPGIQHVYGSADLRDPTEDVLPSTFSDHDMLVVRAELTPR
jgi:endonuclease/exonuclease/phosphatase family metal-dependent hydrolase